MQMRLYMQSVPTAQKKALKAVPALGMGNSLYLTPKINPTSTSLP